MDPASAPKPALVHYHSVSDMSDFTDSNHIKVWFDEMEKKTVHHLDSQGVLYRGLKTLVDRRFDNVLCPDATCVQVDDLFIHANYILMPDGSKFIASQAPFSPKGQECFWKAMMKNCKVFLDLTKAEEVPEIYFPTMSYDEVSLPPSLKTLSLNDSNSPVELDDFPTELHHMNRGRVSITCLERKDLYAPRISIYKYLVRDNTPNVSQEDREKTITRIKYFDWEDFSGSSAESVEVLNQYVDAELLKFVPEDARSFIGVHCRAGVGRTGTFVMCRAMRNAIQKMEVTSANVITKTEEALLAGRKARGPLFLQSAPQAMTVWNFINKELKKVQP